MALRAYGHSQKVFIFQFLKSKGLTGEKVALRHLPGIEVIQGGLGFLPDPETPAFKDHQVAAEKTLQRSLEILKCGTYDLVILDEIGTAILKGVLAEEKVLEIIRQKAEETSLVLTGRGVSDQLDETGRYGYPDGVSQTWSQTRP